ncbi:hypothetical protein PVIIG_06118 [Plasmodium vivax India VII]|uniref:Uncharacterized protein n=1 Tax=Plasmodium vivax India VII TaxID=1077284 RepID=A0A0J9S3G6_PLAVI|nr:hypothetical protein PVIIG_06118 [Plasmodium vivax India VII]
MVRLSDNKRNYENYKKDSNFVNYWLNYKIRESKLNGSVCVNKFSQGMEQQCVETLKLNYSSDFIYHIDEEDFQKMKLLYILYENYSILNKLINNSTSEEPKLLLDPSNNCYDNYKKARNMCYDKNNKFCQKLEKFKSKYEALYTILETKDEEFSKNFKRLPEDENSKIISTATIGSVVGLIPLFGVLYRVSKLNIKFRIYKYIIKLILIIRNNFTLKYTYAYFFY